MAIKPSVKSFRAIEKRAREDLEVRAGVNHWSNDSVAKSLLDSLVVEHRLIANRSSKAIESIQIGSAKGAALEALAENRGVSRLKTTYSKTDSGEANFAFYVSSGTFGDINSGMDINIPAGTKVSPGDSLTPGVVLGDSQVIQYSVASDYVLKADRSVVYCSIKAMTPGRLQNVGKDVLISHSFTSYSLAAQKGLLCSNRFSILNGRNQEDDDSLRFRISNHYAALASSNETALKMRALTVPGVLDVKLIPNYYGIGTAAVFVFGAEDESNTRMIQMVQEKIGDMQTAGLKIQAEAGVAVKFDFKITMHTKEALTATEKKIAKRGVLMALNQFFARSSSSHIRTVSLRAIYKTIVLNDSLKHLILTKGNFEEMFDYVYIRKSYSNVSSTSERLTLDAKRYTLADYEYACLGSLEISFQRTDLIM